MITVKRPSDLLQVNIPSPHLNLIQLRFRQLRQIYGESYDPEKDGYLVYVEAGEDDLPLSELVWITSSPTCPSRVLVSIRWPVVTRRFWSPTTASP